MKSVSTTLAILILLVACSERERYAERYLDSVSLNIYMNRSFEVNGYLKNQYSPVDALRSQGIFGISQLAFACSIQDSIEIVRNMQNVPIPTEITTNRTGSLTAVYYRQAGITWEPRYNWAMQGDSCFFTATVTLRNSTGREWFAERITMMDDRSDEAVCRVSDTLIVALGDLEMGWWSATGRALPLTLSYGWPNSAQWNQLIPCFVPSSGVVLEERPDGGEWPIQSGDTLWVSPEPLLETSHVLEQSGNGYSGILQVYNQTNEYREIRITHPDVLPRGAYFVEGDDFPSFVGMFPGDVVLLEYQIIYHL